MSTADHTTTAAADTAAQDRALAATAAAHAERAADQLAALRGIETLPDSVRLALAEAEESALDAAEYARQAAGVAVDPDGAAADAEQAWRSAVDAQVAREAAAG